MKNKCEGCIYCRFVRDMGGGGYNVCVNKNYKTSWPEFNGSCPYLKIKPNTLKRRKR